MNLKNVYGLQQVPKIIAFNLQPLDLVKSNIHGLHSLQPINFGILLSEYAEIHKQFLNSSELIQILLYFVALRPETPCK